MNSMSGFWSSILIEAAQYATRAGCMPGWVGTLSDISQMPAFEVENRTPAPVGFQLAGDFGRLRRVFEARAGEGARIRRGRASKGRLKAQLSPRASAKWIVCDSAARDVGNGLGRS